MPRLRQAYINSTGGTGKGSDVNFSKLQGELDAISQENILNFKTPPFFTVIIRSLTILEGFALSVDPKFRLVRGAYPYVLQQLLTPENDENTPEALRKLLVRLLTVNGEGMFIQFFLSRSCNYCYTTSYKLIIYDFTRDRDRMGTPERSFETCTKSEKKLRPIR